MKYLLSFFIPLLLVGCCSFSDKAEKPFKDAVREAGYYFPKLKTTMTGVGGVFEIHQNQERLGDGEVVYAFPGQKGWLPNETVMVQEAIFALPNFSRESAFDISGGADFGQFTNFPFKFNAKFKGTKQVVLKLSRLKQQDIALSQLKEWFDANPHKYVEVKGKFIVLSTIAAYQLHYQFMDSSNNAIAFSNSDLVKAMGLDLNLDAKWSHSDKYSLTYTADEKDGKPIVIGYKAAMIVPKAPSSNQGNEGDLGFEVISYDGKNISALMGVE